MSIHVRLNHVKSIYKHNIWIFEASKTLNVLTFQPNVCAVYGTNHRRKAVKGKNPSCADAISLGVTGNWTCRWRRATVTVVTLLRIRLTLALDTMCQWHVPPDNFPLRKSEALWKLEAKHLSHGFCWLLVPNGVTTNLLDALLLSDWTDISWTFFYRYIHPTD
jgi:hypothetical protein